MSSFSEYVFNQKRVTVSKGTSAICNDVRTENYVKPYVLYDSMWFLKFLNHIGT